MWIKILCIEYILWGIPTIESTFDVANMVKTATVKDVPINKWCSSKHTGLLNSCLGKSCLHPYLVVPLISARVTLISTRVSAHCQAILLPTAIMIDADLGTKRYSFAVHAKSCPWVFVRPSCPLSKMKNLLWYKIWQMSDNFEGADGKWWI